jgi:hypothetical protein
LILSGFLLVFCQTIHAVTPVRWSDWKVVHPLPNGENLVAVTWGSPGCVVLGLEGEIVFSPDGITWQPVLSPLKKSKETGGWMFDVCYGNGTFVAVGGHVYSSGDGLNWEVVNPDYPDYLRGVDYGNGQFVAVGETGILTSTDGLSWVALDGAPGLWKIAYGNGRWVGITGRGDFYVTDDLVSWTFVDETPLLPYNAPAQRDICYGNGRFLSVGGVGGEGRASIVQWSEDGITWSRASALDGEQMWGVVQGCTYANGIYVMVGSFLQYDYSPLLSYTSLDADIWNRDRTFAPSGFHAPNTYLRDVAGEDGRPFVAVTYFGEIWTSANGIDWTLVEPEPRDYLNDILHKDGRYVAVGGRPHYIGGWPGSAIILSSVNGIDWEATVPDRDVPLNSVAFGNGLWVAAGDDGGIFTSEDALLWTDRSISTTSNDLEIVVYGAGRFVAFPRTLNRIYTSVDGISWQVLDGPPVALVTCAGFFDNTFIACGDDGLILVSTDGLIWEDRSLSTSLDIRSVSFGKGRYVLAGRGSTLASSGGLDWTVTELERPPLKVRYAEGWFIGNNLLISRDGLHWEYGVTDFYPGEYDLEQFTVTEGRMVAVSGVELWNSRIELPQTAGPNLIKDSGLEYRSRANHGYQLMRSLDLSAWSPSGDVLEGTGDYLFWEVGFDLPKSFWKVEEFPDPVE